MLNSTLNNIAIVALPIIGAIAIEMLRIYGTKLKEDLNPAIAIIRPYFPAIDAAMALAPPELLNRIRYNPVANIVTEMLAEDGDELTPAQVAGAARWAAQQFNFNIHESFVPARTDPANAALANRVVRRLSDRVFQSGQRPGSGTGSTVVED